MSTITQDDPVVVLQADVKKSVRTHLNLMAVKSDTKIGDVITDLLREHGGYAEPSQGDKSVPGGPGARQSNKHIGEEGTGR